MNERIILHADLNNFYASVECLHNPDIRGKAVAVCGDAELRHGIVLAKNYVAKSFGIKTGDVIWEAKQKCPNLVVLSADFSLYLRFSKLARKIYERYTDRIESFGVDECWLDVTGAGIDGKKIADEIRERIYDEMGVTASVGVSWNKIFAKLGSDMKKPDATTVIDKSNYQDTVFPLPVKDLLYVGRATKAKLNKYSIYTIGDLARADIEFLKFRLGKWGEYIWSFANGFDANPVALSGADSIVKSVGNSTTAIRDLRNADDVEMIVTVLSESVAARLREQWLKGRTVHIYLRDSGLNGFSMQKSIMQPTFLSEEIIDTAMTIYRQCYEHKLPVRSVGISVSGLGSADSPVQTDMFLSDEQRRKAEIVESTVGEIRSRFGHFALSRATVLKDQRLTGFSPKEENLIHPYSYFHP